jgi:WD40 repeat protein
LFDAGEADGEVVIFAVNLQDGSVTEFIKLPISAIEVFAVSPDASKIAVANKDGMIRIMDMAGGRELSAFQGTGEPVDLDWNPSGNQLAVLSYHATLQIWDVSRLLPEAPTLPEATPGYTPT